MFETQLLAILTEVRHAVIGSAAQLSLSLTEFTELMHLLPNMQLRFYRSADHVEPQNLPVSSTQNDEGKTICTIHYTAKAKEMRECPPLVEARLVHELTHSIRFLFAVRQEEIQEENHEKQDEEETVEGGPVKRQRTMRAPPFNKAPTETPTRSPAENERRYKLQQKDIHSGYLVEHQIRGGVVVVVQGRLEEAAKRVEAQYVKVAEVEHNSDGCENMKCQVWSIQEQKFEPQKDYRFRGRRVARGDDRE